MQRSLSPGPARHRYAQFYFACWAGLLSFLIIDRVDHAISPPQTAILDAWAVAVDPIATGALRNSDAAPRRRQMIVPRQANATPAQTPIVLANNELSGKRRYRSRRGNSSNPIDYGALRSGGSFSQDAGPYTPINVALLKAMPEYNVVVCMAGCASKDGKPHVVSAERRVVKTRVTVAEFVETKSSNEVAAKVDVINPASETVVEEVAETGTREVVAVAVEKTIERKESKMACVGGCGYAARAPARLQAIAMARQVIEAHHVQTVASVEARRLPLTVRSAQAAAPDRMLQKYITDKKRERLARLAKKRRSMGSNRRVRRARYQRMAAWRRTRPKMPKVRFRRVYRVN